MIILNPEEQELIAKINSGKYPDILEYKRVTDIGYFTRDDMRHMMTESEIRKVLSHIEFSFEDSDVLDLFRSFVIVIDSDGVVQEAWGLVTLLIFHDTYAYKLL